MANIAHLKILILGFRYWNRWREENQEKIPDLSGSNLSGANLVEADLFGANLFCTNLTEANLTEAQLSGANLFKANLTKARLHRAELLHTVNFGPTNLSEANLTEADLSNAQLMDANLFRAKLSGTHLIKANMSRANLSEADLTEADLTEVNLHSANLSGTTLSKTNLPGANLTEANLIEADLTGTNLYGTLLIGSKITNCNFSESNLGTTIFGLTDLSTCKGLQSVKVTDPCIVDFPTLRVSKNLPKEFLTKLGIPDLLTEYLPDFYNPALMIYPAFLSHSWADKAFVRTLYEALTKKGVTVWLDERKIKPGDNIHDSIAEGIKYYDKLILVCSENSLKSWWVEKELERVYEKELQLQKQHGKKFRLVIPIRVDDEIFNSEGGIFDTLRNSMIGDFTKWQDESEFEKAVKELVDALNANRPDIKPPSFLLS